MIPTLLQVRHLLQVEDIFDKTSLVFALHVSVDVVFKVLRHFLQLKSWKIATLILNVTQIMMHVADHKFFPPF